MRDKHRQRLMQEIQMEKNTQNSALQHAAPHEGNTHTAPCTHTHTASCSSSSRVTEQSTNALKTSSTQASEECAASHSMHTDAIKTQHRKCWRAFRIIPQSFVCLNKQSKQTFHEQNETKTKPFKPGENRDVWLANREHAQYTTESRNSKGNKTEQPHAVNNPHSARQQPIQNSPETHRICSSDATMHC